MSNLYPPNVTLREAREIYFEINGFFNGGYDDKWVKMKAGPIPIAFPNTKARVKAVKFHDLHHVLTEYPTTWSGEAEIGAWEVSTGCAYHYPAWLLNLYAFAIGLVISPIRTYDAFIRGRHTSNLYRSEFSDALLARLVGDVRVELGLLDSNTRATLSNKLSFVGWTLVSVFSYVVTGMLVLIPLILLVVLVSVP